MGRQIKSIYKKAEASFNNPDQKKKWQGGIGVLVMVVFVLSSVLFNNTVQALNQAAGNYGYYSDAYGYGGASDSSRITSDAPPAAPTVATANRSAGGLTITVTAPAYTTIGSSSAVEGTGTLFLHDNSGCTGTEVASGDAAASGTLTYQDTTATSAGTTYSYCAKYRDVNLNLSSTGTASAAGVAAAGGGTAGGGTTGGSVGSAPPKGDVTPLAQAAPAAGTPAAVTQSVTNLGTLGVGLANGQSVAQALGTTLAKLDAKKSVVEKAVLDILVGKKLGAEGETQKVAFNKLEDLGLLKDKLITVLSGVAALNQHTSTPERIASKLSKLSGDFGADLMKDAGKNENTAQYIAEYAGVTALGGDFVRTPESAKKCRACNARVEKAEANALPYFLAILGEAPGKSDSAARGVYFESVHRFATDSAPSTFNKDRELKANSLVFAKVLDKNISKNATVNKHDDLIKVEKVASVNVSSIPQLGLLAKGKSKTIQQVAAPLYAFATRLSNGLAYSKVSL